MARKERDERGHVRFEALKERKALGIKTLARIEFLPQRRDARPLRMRIERLADGGAKLDAQPRCGMGIVEIGAEDKRARQADDSDQTERRGDADPRHRPEISHDFGNPALPYRPEVAIGIAVALQTLQHSSQRRHKIEKRGRLVSCFMDERGCDAAPHHALAGHFDDRGGIASAARESRAGAPDRRSGSTLEVADDGGQFIEPTRQGERICGNDVQTGQPRAIVLFAALGNDVAKHVKLVEHCVKPQPQNRKTALCLLRCCTGL